MHRVARSDPKTAQGIHHSHPPTCEKHRRTKPGRRRTARPCSRKPPSPNQTDVTAPLFDQDPDHSRTGEPLWAPSCAMCTGRRCAVAVPPADEEPAGFTPTGRLPPRGRSRTTPRHGHSLLVDSPQDDRASTKFTHRHAAQPPPGQHSSGRHRTCNDPRARRSCKKSAPIASDGASGKSALGQQESCHSCSQTATPWNLPPPRLRSAPRSAVLPRATGKQETVPGHHPPTSHRHSSISAAQRTLPRGFSAPGGSSGAGSGAPS
ncbi:hypothetical protein SHIRM173S_07338 [Streptomyces hirsutus]